MLCLTANLKPQQLSTNYKFEKVYILCFVRYFIIKLIQTSNLKMFRIGYIFI